MKRPLSMLLAVVLLPAVFAARAEIDPISSDPYTSAIVIDADTGKVLFEDNADGPVYPASVVKLMDLLLIVELLDGGRAELTDIVSVTSQAEGMGGSQIYLKKGETFSVDEMLYALTLKSANDAAVALAVHFSGSTGKFVSLMNKRAAALGMTSTSFASVHGLPPSEGQEPDVSTARDIAILSMEVIKYPSALRYTVAKERSFRNNTFPVSTHNRLLHDVDGCDGLKTGYIRIGGYSISATALRDGRRVIAVVMGCSNRQTRDAKARELLDYGFLNLPAPQGP